MIRRFSLTSIVKIVIHTHTQTDTHSHTHTHVRITWSVGNRNLMRLQFVYSPHKCIELSRILYSRVGVQYIVRAVCLSLCQQQQVTNQVTHRVIYPNSYLNNDKTQANQDQHSVRNIRMWRIIQV